jgi:hypothetical protein
MGNKIKTEADKNSRRPPKHRGVTFTVGKGQKISKERGSHTRTKKSPGKRARKGGGPDARQSCTAALRRACRPGRGARYEWNWPAGPAVGAVAGGIMLRVTELRPALDTLDQLVHG